MRTERLMAAAAAAILLLAVAGCGVDDDAAVLGAATKPPPTVTITEVHVHGSTSPSPSGPTVDFGVLTSDPGVTLASPSPSDDFEIKFIRGAGGTQSATLQDNTGPTDLIIITVSDQ